MSSFDEMCKEAVERFIQTVAIIDDMATYDNNSQSDDDKDKTKTLTPPANGLTTDILEQESPSTEKGPEDNDDNLGQLDAKVVINAFADMGITCCIQRPKHEESSCERAVKLATSADILVLDWVLDKKNITLPRDIIKQVMKEDKSKGGRMRLIVVYTSHNYVDQMLKDLKEDADDVYDGILRMDKKQLTIANDCLRIVILNKEKTKNPPEEARIVPFSDLPNNIILEYVELMKGIIPGVTLHSIAAMREKTHALLSILNRNLDGAYCLHRAFLLEPSDSVDFAMNLITSEIETVIQSDAKARQFVDRNGIKEWLIQKAGDEKKFPYCNSSLSVKTIENCILNGQLSKKEEVTNIKKEYATNWIQAKYDAGEILKNDEDEDITLTDAKKYIKQNKLERIKGCKPPVETRFAETLYSTSKEAINGCKELSRLNCTTRDTVSRPYIDEQHGPTIKLGSILKVRKKDHNDLVDDWFLCLTPLCDCIRLEKEEKVEFLFLHLYPGKKDNADIYVETQKGEIEPLVFRGKNRKIELLTIPFFPDKNDRIRAKFCKNKWRVKSKRKNYQWIAELRNNKALAIAHHVAANTSRVGIDEFEWFRRQAP
ncbi:MAG: hypothetical protein FP824_03765 [Euryarchaeota archaeon]|nr:hypothetical protein [Euryarchaeota archaeon]MBU4143317.1 hypothetical protein [Candidatus Thermoplasmatota archaeon]